LSIKLFGKRCGPECYLCEEEACTFHIPVSKKGYEINCGKSIVSKVEEFVVLSNGWWVSFRQRYPFITLRTVEKLSYSRLIAYDEGGLLL
jgi:hypothetical protein